MRQIAAHTWAYGTVHDARRVAWIPNANETDTIVAYVDDDTGPRGPVDQRSRPSNRSTAFASRSVRSKLRS